MKFSEYGENVVVSDNDVLLIQEANTLALKRIKFSTLKQYTGSGSASGIAYLPETTAVISAIEATGLILSNNQKNACNKRIADMQEAGVWSKRIAYYGFLGGTGASHAINWKNPGTYNITWLGGMTHDLLGIKSNGSTGYGDTGLTESLFNPASTHISIYSRTTEETGNFRDVGVTTADGFELIIAFQNGSYYRSFKTTTGIEAVSQTIKTGHFTGTRNNTNAAIYRNGISYRTSTTASGTATIAGTIGICKSSNNYTKKQLCSVGLGAGLTETEVILDSNSEATYQSALNRQAQ